MYGRRGSNPSSTGSALPARARRSAARARADRPARRFALGTILAPVIGTVFGSAPATAAAADASRTEFPLPALGSAISIPDLTLLDGSRLDAAARAGRTTVLYWWASWCPFCAEQSPLMDRLWRSEQNNGLLVLGLSIDRQAKVAADHLKRKGYRFPSAWLSPELEKQLPKPKGLPVVVVVGPDGKVLAAEAGQMFDEDVADLARWAPGRGKPSDG